MTIMKNFFCFSLALFAIGFVLIPLAFAEMAPVNPEFTRYIEHPEEFRRGFRPAPINLSHLRKKTGASAASPGRFLRLAAQAETIPSAWDSRDVHGTNWITSVKDQGSYGTCWAHSTMAALETAFVKNGYCSRDAIDLSENHLANHAAHGSGFEWGFGDGGNNYIAIARLTSWHDPLLETDDPYPNPESIASTLPMCHVQNAVLIAARNNSSDNDGLKKAVMKYGAISVSYYHSDKYANSQTGAYCIKGTSASNHAVTLVGWDDNYSTNNFLVSCRPESNGAFLIKNSWGPSASATTNGYIWISYCDSSLCYSESAAYPLPASTNLYGKIYEYDSCGMISAWSANWAANVYTASSTGIVSAVGCYSQGPNTLYEVYVYTGVDLDAPRSGTLAATVTGTFADTGYFTVPLTNDVNLSSVGERFSVIVRLETPGYDYPQAIHGPYDGYCSVVSDLHRSYDSEDGVTWTDLHAQENNWCFCIKAYTKYGSDEQHVPVTLHVMADSEIEDPDGSEDKPFPTIAIALEHAGEGDSICVGPGTYDGVTVPSGLAAIVAVNGAASTIIDGGGTNRCFDALSCPTTVLSGFTLTNGWADASLGYADGAGARYGVLTNCVITGCRAEGDYGYGGGAANATLVDCVIENCCADWCGGGVYGCTASYCLIRDNGTYYSNAAGGGAAYSELTHCTVYGNESGESAGGVDYACACTDSIVWGNTLANGETSNWESFTYQGKHYVTTFASSCTTPSGYADDGGNTNDSPRWVDAPAGDFRLAVKSPCLGTASDGLNMGAWQGAAVPGYIITSSANGPGVVEPASAFVIEGQSATFIATMHHPFLGWTTNGVFAADASTNAFTWCDVRQDGVLTASFGPTNFFVDAANGNDASNGWSWAEAKRTIQAAVDVAGNGERVSVNPGTYDSVEASASLLDIVGVEGPDATFIDGGNTNRCYVGYDNKSTVLRGFTLENGVSTNNYGGGVLYGTLSNCVIRNCVAAKGGGGACCANLTDCVIAGCTAGGQGGGACESTLINCTVRGNTACSWRSYYSWYYGCDYGGGIDCLCVCTNTIVWGNSRLDGTSDNWEYWLGFDRYDWYSIEPDFYWCCTTPASKHAANSITDDPLFASTNVDDASVYEISPCIGIGYGGANIGAYRGTGIVKALPAIDVTTASGEEVSNAVASVGYVDKAVEAGIGTNGATYAAFSAWSTNGLKSTAVVFSTRAYDSFLVRELVAAPTILGEGNETTVELSSLEPSDDGTCSTVVRLMDGDSEVPLCSVKAAFAKHTNVGSDLNSLSPADPANVEAESVEEGLAVKLTITPPSNTSCYFMNFIVR